MRNRSDKYTQNLYLSPPKSPPDWRECVPMPEATLHTTMRLLAPSI